MLTHLSVAARGSRPPGTRRARARGCARCACPAGASRRSMPGSRARWWRRRGRGPARRTHGDQGGGRLGGDAAAAVRRRDRPVEARPRARYRRPGSGHEGRRPNGPSAGTSPTRPTRSPDSRSSDPALAVRRLAQLVELLVGEAGPPQPPLPVAPDHLLDRAPIGGDSSSRTVSRGVRSGGMRTPATLPPPRGAGTLAADARRPGDHGRRLPRRRRDRQRRHRRRAAAAGRDRVRADAGAARATATGCASCSCASRAAASPATRT